MQNKNNGIYQESCGLSIFSGKSGYPCDLSSNNFRGINWPSSPPKKWERTMSFWEIQNRWLRPLFLEVDTKNYCWWQPEVQRSPLEVGSSSYYLQGVLHPRYLFGISEPSTVGTFLKHVHPGGCWNCHGQKHQKRPCQRASKRHGKKNIFSSWVS